MSQRLKEVVSVPSQTFRVRIESCGRDDALAVSGRELLNDVAVSVVFNTFADGEGQIVVDCHEAGVEQAIERGGEANAVGGVGTAGLADAPWNDMTGNETFGDRQAGDATAAVVAAQNGVTEKGLMQALLCRDQAFAGAFGRGEDGWRFSRQIESDSDLLCLGHKRVPILVEFVPNDSVEPAAMREAGNASRRELWVEGPEVAELAGDGSRSSLDFCREVPDEGVALRNGAEGDSAIEFEREDELIACPRCAVVGWTLRHGLARNR